MKAIDKLRKNFPQFTWTQENSTSSLFGVLQIPQRKIIINGDSYELNNVCIFISGKMGGTKNNPPFRYAICYQKGTRRLYRHKNKFDIEYNKLFVSDKDLNSIVNQLIKKVDLNRYYLSK